MIDVLKKLLDQKISPTALIETVWGKKSGQEPGSSGPSEPCKRGWRRQAMLWKEVCPKAPSFPIWDPVPS